MQNSKIPPPGSPPPLQEVPVAQPKPSTFRGTAIVGSLTLASRVLGFIRDALVARLFGSSPIADAFFVAFRIPNLLRSFVAEGAMTSAFVPVFTSELQRGKEAAQAALRSMLSLLLLLTTMLTALGIVFAPTVIHLIAPGFGRDPEQFSLCVELTQFMMPYILCISVVALIGGSLNAVGIFGAAALAQVWMNIVLIAGAIIAQGMHERGAALVLSVSVLVGGVVQIVTQLPALRRSGFSLVPSLVLFSPATRQMLLLMGPALLGATVYQVGIFLNTVFASSLQSGSVSWLFYADRLVQLPIGIFSIALASVLLPALSRAQTAGDSYTFSSELQRSLRATSFVIIPVSFGLYFYAEPLSRIVFERGAFDATSTAMTASALKAYAFGIWATSCHSMLTRAFIAQKNTRTPMLIGLASLLVVVVSSLALMGTPTLSGDGSRSWALTPIQAGQTILSSIGLSWNLGHQGLALASSLGSCAALVLAALILSKSTSLSTRGLLTHAVSISLISLVSVAGSALLFGQYPALIQLIGGGSASILAFVALAWVFRVEELTLMANMLKTKFQRKNA